MRASICGEYFFSELGALCAFARGNPVIVRNGDKFLFVVVSGQTKKVSFWQKGIFSHVLRLCGEWPSPNLR